MTSTGGTEPAGRGRIVAARPAGVLTPVVLSMILLVLLGCTPAHRDPAGVRISRGGDPDHGYHGTVPPDPWPLPNETFVDTSGNAYNLARTPSRPVTLVFFGYTHCPDVCTGVLSDVASALQRSEPSVRGEIGLVFVTTDPHRDTPPVIKNYLARFDPEFVGLTGAPGQIRTVAESFGVDISGTKQLSDGGYEVSHSAQVIAFDKTGRAAVQWTPGTPIADLIADYALVTQRQR